MVIHRRPGDITASDCRPLSHGFLGRNLLLNGLPGLKYEAGNGGAAIRRVDRSPNRSNRSPFNRAMAMLGFTLTETAIDAPLDDGSPCLGRLLQYRRV